MIWRNIFPVRVILWFYHTVTLWQCTLSQCGNFKNLLSNFVNATFLQKLLKWHKSYLNFRIFLFFQTLQTFCFNLAFLGLKKCWPWSPWDIIRHRILFPQTFFGFQKLIFTLGISFRWSSLALVFYKCRTLTFKLLEISGKICFRVKVRNCKWNFKGTFFSARFYVKWNLAFWRLIDCNFVSFIMF